MSAEKLTDNFFDMKLLQKKRAKSKKRTNNDDNELHKKKEKENSLNKNNFYEKNIDNAKKKITDFLNFDWDNIALEKQSMHISKCITGSIFWFLIDSSYFKQDNIKNNVNEIIKKLDKDIIDDKNYSLTKNNNIIINNDKINKNYSENSDIDKNKLIDDKDCLDVINLVINKIKDKSFKYTNRMIDYPRIKNKIVNYYKRLHSINEKKIPKLIKKSNDIQLKYNSKNDTKNIILEEIEDKLEENYLYQKNSVSYNIRNKFWNYLHKKEKEFLIKRDDINNKQENDKENDKEKDKENENKNEFVEDNFYIDACNVCNVEDLGIYNNLYECIQCGIRVHQLCYRIKTSPDPQKWKCSKCKSFSSRDANNIECILCPVTGGAMQRTKISKDSNFYKEIMKFRKDDSKNNYIHIQENYTIDHEHQDYPWIHLSCALSNSDVKIDIFDKKKHIKFDEKNILQNYNSKCYICKTNNCGPTKKCKFENCDIYCHPECARINDYYFETDNFEKGVPFEFYCHKHRPNRFINYLNKSSSCYNREIFSFCNDLNFVYQYYENNKLKNIHQTENRDKEQNSDLNDKEKNERMKNKSKGRSKGRSKNRVNKTFKQNIKKKSPSVKEVCIDTKANDKKLPEKNNDNIEEENNIMTNNCVGKIKTNSNENCLNSNIINMTNETNSIKSNNSHNSSENNKLSTKYESLTQSSDDSKYELTMSLVKHLQSFFKINRLILKKDDGQYSKPTNEDIEEAMKYNLYNIEFSDIKEGNFDINKLEIKKEFNKTSRNIYKDEEEFKRFYQENLDKILSSSSDAVVENIEIKKEEFYINEIKKKIKGKTAKSKKNI